VRIAKVVPYGKRAIVPYPHEPIVVFRVNVLFKALVGFKCSVRFFRDCHDKIFVKAVCVWRIRKKKKSKRRSTETLERQMKRLLKGVHQAVCN
jgi:hypothetical protein